MAITSIFKTFPITSSEYEQLESKFGSLSHFIAWQLKRKNAKNNYTEEIEDIAQEIRFSIVRAGSYYKRQIYLEECLEVAKRYVKDKFTLSIVHKLENLWKQRTRHGANKQKFGEYQESILEKIIQVVPLNQQPSRNRNLTIDKKFTTYCKAIAWNCQKNLGKKISKERVLRSGMTSLSMFDYLGED